MYTFVYYLLYPFFRLFCHFKVEGRENIPDGNFIIISNHTAYKDPLILAFAIKRKNIRFVAKSDLQRFSFFKLVFKALKVISIRRNTSDLTALRECISSLNAGDNICIFPQGTRITDEAPKKEQALAGVGLIIGKSEATVLPVAIKYPENKGGLTGIRVCIGKPITSDEYLKPDADGQPPKRIDTAYMVFDEVCKMHKKM